MGVYVMVGVLLIALVLCTGDCDKEREARIVEPQGIGGLSPLKPRPQCEKCGKRCPCSDPEPVEEPPPSDGHGVGMEPPPTP